MKNTDKVVTLIGNGSEFEGKLRFLGTARVDGRLRGEIMSRGNLIVGENAIIEGLIQVSYILITGEIRGDIIAGQRVDIRSPGRVYGNVETPTMVMQEGALFDGDCKMPSIEEAEKLTVLLPDDQKEALPAPDLAVIQGRVTGGRPSDLEQLDDIINAKEDDHVAQPIKNAKIHAKCKGIGKKSTRTDGTGHYRFSDMEDGKWKLTVKAKGYEEAAATVEISGGGVYVQDFD